MTNLIIKHFNSSTKANNLRRGTLVAFRDTNDRNRVKIGWSVCVPSDRFVKKMGLKIALGRASVPYIDDDRTKWPAFPDSVKLVLPSFYKRCAKYFKENAIYIGGLPFTEKGICLVCEP